MATDDADDLVPFLDVRVIRSTAPPCSAGSRTGVFGFRAGTSAARSGAPGIAASC